MNKKIRSVLLWGLLAIASISLVAGAYAITKEPESSFVSRIRLPQLSFENETSFDAAAAQIQLQYEAFLNKPITLTSSRGELSTTVQGLGVLAEVSSAQQYLINFMEDAGPLKKIQVFLFGETLYIPVSVDDEQLRTAFAETNIEQGQSNAVFSYDGSTVSIIPEQIGYGVDTAALTKMLQDYWDDQFQVPESADLPLRTSNPEIMSSDLEPLLEKAQGLMSRTLTLQDEFGNTWSLNMSDHIDWIVPNPAEASTGFSWELSETAFVTYVETDLVPEVEQDPEPATIIENEDGTYGFEGSARFGKRIEKLDLRADIFAALEAEPSEATIEIPVRHEQPEITVPDSLKERGITQLVGVGYSTYKTSPSNRIQNVNHGFQVFNGVIVPQGEEFSFTTLMGPVDAAHGWLPELVIKGDETIPEYGGGMCQVSSTMFRAALYSGLPITARKNHSYAVSYYAYPYGYGLDATVYDPNPDLKFINDTPGDLLIQGYTDGFDAYFVFYGTNDGRTVQMEGPYSYDYVGPPTAETEYTDELDPGVRVLDEYGHTGFKVDWYRTVVYPTYSEEELAEGSYVSPYAATASGVRENFHSNYEARPAKYLEGSSAEGTEAPAN